ncbi:MAG: hypothetical protein ACRDBI_09115, partial [Shewanella sp.]
MDKQSGIIQSCRSWAGHIYLSGLCCQYAMVRHLGVFLCIAVLLLFSSVSNAAPACNSIFTDPPTGNHFPNGLEPPPGIPSSANLICDSKGCDIHSNQFTPGDYGYNQGTFKNGAVITTTGRTARLYFNNLSLTNAKLNSGGKAENLIIYVKNSLSVSGLNQINAIV